MLCRASDTAEVRNPELSRLLESRNLLIFKGSLAADWVGWTLGTKMYEFHSKASESESLRALVVLHMP